MFNSDNNNWSSLQDAYGEASKVPELLEEVIKNNQPQSDPEHGPWFDLWSRLCHQGTIYDASYVAVPILVKNIPKTRTVIDMNFFLLPLCIEIARNQTNSPEVPSEVKEDYFQSLEDLVQLAEEYDSENNDEHLKKVLKAIKLVNSGEYQQAEEMLD